MNNNVKRMAKCYSKLGAVRCRMTFVLVNMRIFTYLSFDLVRLILNYLEIYDPITNENIHDVVKNYCNPYTHVEILERFGNIKCWDVSKITNIV